MVSHVKCIVLFAAVSVTGAHAEHATIPQSPSVSPFEEPCVSAGGLCVLRSDCAEVFAEKGLCPRQQRFGVECCAGLSTKETICKNRGGICVPKLSVCNEKLVFKEAEDCTQNEKCCILVR